MEIKLTKSILILIVVGWVLLTLFNYYFMNFFFLIFELIGLILTLLIVSVVQIIQLIKERKLLSKLRIQKVVVFICLFILTLNHFTINKIIEKIDWRIFYNKRVEIVEQIRNKEINSNTDRHFWKYELPYKFPIISNGGNDIMISRDDSLNTMTVEFWIFRNFFESPSTQFVFTNDPKEIMKIESKIGKSPDENWKIEDGWYRTYGD